MKTIVVTGANGYIGQHVVRKLAESGERIVALDIVASDACEHVEWVSTDIFDDSFNIVDVAGCVPDICLHLAWRDGFQHNASSHMMDLSSHYAFLSGLVDAGVSQIAVMGSMHEIGYWEGAITDDTPCNPQSCYGVAKDALRRSLFLMQNEKPFILQWLRGFYIFGDDEQSQSIFGKLVRAARAGQRTFPFTTGVNKYDFTSVFTLAEMIAAVVLQDNVTGIINCCSGKPVSLANQIEKFIADNALDIKLEYGAFPDRPYDSPGVWGDPSKIQKILG